MTQEEFYLRAMLALASNPNYVKTEVSDEDPSVITNVLQTEEIQMDADRLLKEAQRSWIDAFDTSFDCEKESLKAIAEAVSELNKSGIKAYVEEG